MWSQVEYELIHITEPRIDFNISGLLREHVESLTNNGKVNIVLDMAEVNDIGSMGIGALVSILKKLKAKDGNLKVIGVKGKVLATFKLAKIDSILDVHLKGDES